MKTRNQFQKEHSVKVLKSFPQEKAVTSDIAIIDSRSCIRDAMANAFLGNTERRVFTASSFDALGETPFVCNPSPRQLILFCDGSLTIDSIQEQLSSIINGNLNARLVILTDNPQHRELTKLVKEFNVDGIIPSHYDTRQLLACIQVIESGIGYFPNEIVHNKANGLNTANEINTDTRKILTPRQMQVMEYIFEGKSNKFIAAELSVSESTIKVHVHEAMKRLGATSRTHAAYIMGQCDL